MSMIVLSDQYHKEVLGPIFSDGRRCERVVGGVDGLLSGLQCMLAYHHFQLDQIARMSRQGSC